MITSSVLAQEVRNRLLAGRGGVFLFTGLWGGVFGFVDKVIPFELGSPAFVSAGERADVWTDVLRGTRWLRLIKNERWR